VTKFNQIRSSRCVQCGCIATHFQALSVRWCDEIPPCFSLHKGVSLWQMGLYMWCKAASWQSHWERRMHMTLCIMHRSCTFVAAYCQIHSSIHTEQTKHHFYLTWRCSQQAPSWKHADYVSIQKLMKLSFISRVSECKCIYYTGRRWLFYPTVLCYSVASICRRRL